MFRFVCSNGLVCGDTVADVRVPHKGDVAGQVIEGAYQVRASTVRWNPANPCRPSRWTKAKPKCSPTPLSLKYDDPDKPAPITESQILMPRRFDDRRPDLWACSTAPRKT